MIYTLQRGVNGLRVPVRYETDRGLMRFWPAMPLAISMPESDTVKRYAAYSVIPLLSLATLLILILNNHSAQRQGPFAPAQPTNNGQTSSALTNSSNQSSGGSSASNPAGDNGSGTAIVASGGNLQSANGSLSGGSSAPLVGGRGGVSPAPSPQPIVSGGATTSVISVGAVCDTSTCTVTGCSSPVTITQGQKTIVGADGTCVIVN